MRITCLGAARTVTGSAYLVEPDADTKFLVDCGMFQGGRRIEAHNWDNERYQPKDLQAIYITHAHIDHSGLVPRLVRMGYDGPVYASKATAELLRILWADSAYIQEMEAQWQSRKNKRKGSKDIEPLYEGKDAEAASALIQPVEMDVDLTLMSGVGANFVPAGHILGAASLVLTVEAGGKTYRVGFSGDVGRPNQLIVPDPSSFDPPDMLFMETTYGNRLHKTLDQSQKELIEVIHQAYEQGGKVLIPVFAVERTQEIIYTLSAAHRRGEMPEDMPVFLDSPLAIKATNIFREHPEFFDDATTELLNNGHTPLNLPNLQFTLSTEESRAINNHKGSAVIMAGNGMASAGRIKHHMKHNLWRKDCHMVFVGFQARGTTGRRLVEGEKTVKIFREDVSVGATIHTINGFSAHADRDELLAWLEPLVKPGMRVNLMHGEESSSLAFKDTAAAKFPEVSFRVPRMNETIDLEHPGKRITRRASSAVPQPVQEPAREAPAVSQTPPPSTPATPPAQAAAPAGGASLSQIRVALANLLVRLETEGQELTPGMLAELERQVRAASQVLEAS
jgi:metallo-beta-lactamase family protein